MISDIKITPMCSRCGEVFLSSVRSVKCFVCNRLLCTNHFYENHIICVDCNVIRCVNNLLEIVDDLSSTEEYKNLRNAVTELYYDTRK